MRKSTPLALLIALALTLFIAPSTALADLTAGSTENIDASTYGEEAIDETGAEMVLSAELNLIQSGNYKPDTVASAGLSPQSTGSKLTASQIDTITRAILTVLQKWDGKTLGEGNDIVILIRGGTRIPYDDETLGEVNGIISDFINCHPEYFYIGEKFNLYGIQNNEGAFLDKIGLICSYDIANIPAMKVDFEDCLNEAIALVGNAENATDVDKAKAVHDYLVSTCYYNYDAADTSSFDEYGSPDPWNAYGALVRGEPVCQGYSLAFLACMNRYNIDCSYVSQSLRFKNSDGTTYESGHGWNRIEIDGSWYNLDVTWDDNLTDGTTGNKPDAKPNAKFFLKSDDWFIQNAPNDSASLDNNGKGFHTDWSPKGIPGTNTQYDSKDPNEWPYFAISDTSDSVFSSRTVSVTLPQNTYTYTGSPIQPVPTVSFRNAPLNADDDYEVTYSNNTSAGTAMVTISAKEGSGYTGSVSKSFQISRAVISPESIALVDGSSFEYTGNDITPAINVSVNGRALSDGDYDVQYKDCKLPGTASITVTGKGNYTGEATTSFTIEPREYLDVPGPVTNYIYDGTQKTGVQVAASDGYTISGTTSATNAGNYETIVQLNPGYLWNDDKPDATRVYQWTIYPAQATPAVTLGTTSFTYNGGVKTPAVAAVEVGGVPLPASSYSVSYAAGRKGAGTYGVTVTLKGNYAGTGTASFTIYPKQATPTVTLGATSYTYDGGVKTPAVTAVKVDGATLPASSYSVSYAAGRASAGTYGVTVTLRGNYAGTGTASFTIKKAANPIAVKAVARSAKASKLKKKAATLARPLTVKKAQGAVSYKKASGNKKIKVNAKTGKLTLAKGLKRGTYKVKIKTTAKGNANYSAKTVTTTVTVKVK